MEKQRDTFNILYTKGKEGSNEALNAILDSCSKYIKSKAIESYNLIENNIKLYFKINNDNYHISNNLLELEDIIQDLNIKSFVLLKHFLTTNSKRYFSTYLSHMLSSYLKKYVNIKTKKLINKMDNEFNKEINFQYNVYGYDECEDTRKEIIDNIKDDKVLSKYIDFINAIYDNNSNDEISLLTDIEAKRIGSKIEIFTGMYKKHLEKKQPICLEDYINSGMMINDIKNGQLYQMLYFSKDVIFTLHDIYYKLAQKYSISYKLVKEDFCIMLSNYLKINLSYIHNTTNIEYYFSNLLKTVKNVYYSFKEYQLDYVLSKQWDKYTLNNSVISENKIFDLIESGHIYSISPYKEYIDIYIQKIYNNLNSQKYIELNRVNSEIILIINHFIEKYKVILMMDLNLFNHNLIKHLSKKEKQYIDHKISKIKKINK